jgi:D-3-phosphoglycerate dehydrogenase
MEATTDTVENLMVDLLEWVAMKSRTYEETIEAWRTSCPRLPVWEETNDRRLITVEGGLVRVTSQGRAFLAARSAH